MAGLSSKEAKAPGHSGVGGGGASLFLNPPVEADVFSEAADSWGFFRAKRPTPPLMVEWCLVDVAVGAFAASPIVLHTMTVPARVVTMSAISRAMIDLQKIFWGEFRIFFSRSLGHTDKFMFFKTDKVFLLEIRPH